MNNFNPEMEVIGKATLSLVDIITYSNLKYRVNSNLKFSLKSKFKVHESKEC